MFSITINISADAMFPMLCEKRFYNSNKSLLKHLSNGLSCQDSDVSSTEIDEILDGIFKVKSVILFDVL